MILSAADRHPDLLVASLYPVSWYRQHGWQAQYLTGPDIKASAVSWALNLVIEELTLSQRAVVMRAQIGNRIELAADIAQGDSLPSSLKNPDRACRHVGLSRYLHELACHCRKSSLSV